MLKYMLDTNIVIYTMKNRPDHMKKVFNQHHGQMSISAITLGELVFGAEHSQQVELNLIDIKKMTSRLDVIPFGDKAAYHFGQVRAELYSVGKPIGPYDMMIAGHARSLGLKLGTNNINEFERGQGLQVEKWI
jgi:tRNA(fMet)-specific endonuclease VapC